MALLVPDVGEVIALTRIFTAENSVLRLFTNDYTPVEGSVIGSFTQATGTGYAPITLTGTVSGGTWTIATVTGTTTASYPEQTFTFTGAEPTLYGYYVTNAAGTQVLFAERFTSGVPYVIPSGGGTVKITINFTGA